jgi:hypothetical protein
MRRLFLCAVLAACPLGSILPAGAQAEAIIDLYRAHVFVTGERRETRDPALLQGYRDVMVKVSGDARLLADKRLDAGFDASAVHTYSYRDLMAGIPKHDEQGTRDRPFELTIDYAPDKIATALAALDHTAWYEDRPRVLVLIGVELGPSRFILTDEGEPGSVQRQALTTSAHRYGVPIVFPTRAMLDASGLKPDALKSPDAAALEPLRTQAGADRIFAGHMLFSDQVLGWISKWQLPEGETTYRWGIEGVNFDEAFRNAIRGAAQILSGNGAP